MAQINKSIGKGARRTRSNGAVGRGTTSGVQPATGTPVSPGEAHYHALEAHLNGLAHDRVVQARVDLQAAATTALGVAARLDAQEVRARFLSLGAVGGYDPTCVDRLRPAAWAAWYARHRYLAASGTRSRAQLPDGERAPATELRNRMMRVARHNLDDVPVVVRRLDQIDAERGDLGLANGLVALADVYDEHEATLRGDRHYHATDATDARSLGARIIELLGTTDGGADANAWHDRQNRAGTWLSMVYDEVLRGATFLYWNDPRREKLFPSLVTAARTPSVRARASSEPPAPPPPPDDPADPR